MIDDDFLKELGKVFIIFVVIMCLFEVGFLIYGYVNADKVECNLFGCTFTEIKGTSKSYIKSECYENGIKINCSEFNNIMEESQWMNTIN